MKTYYVRHQAAGVAHEHPFSSPPSQAQVDEVISILEDAHGKTHPKTGKPWWAKIVVVDSGLAPRHPDRVKTHAGARGESAEEIDAVAAGPCPVRDSGLARWPDAPEAVAPTGGTGGVAARGSGKGFEDLKAAGSGTVKNPKGG
jgi:hypothetical protein